jgi:hypothetical protein
MVQTAPGQTARVPRTGLCLALLLVIPGATRPARPAVRGQAAIGRYETANPSARTSSRGHGADPFTPAAPRPPGQVPRRSRARQPSGRAVTRSDNPHKVPISGARGITGDTTGAPAPARRPRFREMSAKQAATFTKYPTRVLHGCRSMIAETSRPIGRQSLRHKQNLRDHGRVPRPLNAYKTEISASHTPAACPGPAGLLVLVGGQMNARPAQSGAATARRARGARRPRGANRLKGLLQTFGNTYDKRLPTMPAPRRTGCLSRPIPDRDRQMAQRNRMRPAAYRECGEGCGGLRVRSE